MRCIPWGARANGGEGPWITLRDVILERLQAMDYVRATQTIFVLEEVIRRPFVLP